MVMKYVRLHLAGDAIVVAFDMCSSSDIIEELTLKGDVSRFQKFLTKLKHYLAAAQKTILFDPYKFTGDGWILLFPPKTNGPALLTFLRDLCSFFKEEFRNDVLRYLDTPPSLTGLTFGVEKGPLAPMTMYGGKEYVGRALNIACRLQNAVKDKGGSPAYKVLVSNGVFNDYFSPAVGYKVFRVTRTLRNIRGGAQFQCRKINLLAA
ncbi:MAG: hypothetical protein HY727_19655 [Candidatus Rokubacteria bacterium]|nr:hypothetical protein [Candidatus Rokubacteria bacterium]